MPRFVAITLLLLCIGCSEDPLPSTTSILAPVVEVVSAASAQPELNEEPEGDLKESLAEAIARYQPPFADRVELFVPPQRALDAMPITSDDDQQRVQLNGFASVDELTAILVIDGNLASIPAGGEQYGVHVVAIEPPRVILRRGTTEWSARID